jgi:hypothetical protein
LHRDGGRRRPRALPRRGGVDVNQWKGGGIGYRIDREALAAFVAQQVDLVEAGSIPTLLADVVELRDAGLGWDEVRALWLGAGLATLVGLAIFEEPERFITAGEPSPATPAALAA